MKNLFVLLAVVLLAGSVGCTSAQTQDEAPAPEMAAAPVQEETLPVEEPPAALTEEVLTQSEEPPMPTEPLMPEQEASRSGMSLGTGSSGRGH